MNREGIQLFLCGAAILFWELVLIRWMGSCIRVVAYYTNFILLATFLGLGAGALMVRFKIRLPKFIFPTAFLCILIGPFLGAFPHSNPYYTEEVIWVGSPRGITAATHSENFLNLSFSTTLPYWLVLLVVFILAVWFFVILGQWLGILFKKFKPLKAYTIEIAGSLVGILLFTVLSYFHFTPLTWFLVGFVLLFIIVKPSAINYSVGVVFAVLSLGLIYNFVNHYIWSPYYKIEASPLMKIEEPDTGKTIRFEEPRGYVISVNNDYHQMLLDLRPREDEPYMFSSWRWLYDYPYQEKEKAVEGPILIVGAGTGNDVSAALRNTERKIDVVEIDPSLIELGKKLHMEDPYSNPRVNVHIDDARSYFIKSDKKYSKIVYGFLDSHTLMSSFSSVRLDNFVYTLESLKRAKSLLKPGGKVYLVFSVQTVWIHQRIINMMNKVFDYPTRFVKDSRRKYANGLVYINGKAPEGKADPHKEVASDPSVATPTDNWPYLYMKEPTVPGHYFFFILMIVFLGLSSIFLLPPGQRDIKFIYFFMGAGFFLIETSNVISLSLLYGSTWIVNVTVFSGILVLILLGNLTCAYMKKPRYILLFILLFLSVVISFFVEPSNLLSLEGRFLRGSLAVLIFLGPIYFASIIFAHLIKGEKNLYQAYGSNLLGAVIGGACEYFSLMMGIKFLLLITFAFYLLAFFCLKFYLRAR